MTFAALLLSSQALGESPPTFLTSWGSEGSGPGQFRFPAGIAIGPSGAVFVADAGNHRIQKFGSTGEFMGAWGDSGSGAGQFRSIKGIAIDQSGNIYVADALNQNIQKFTADGYFILSMVGNDDYDHYWDVAIDASGQYVFAVAGFPYIDVFSTSGGPEVKTIRCGPCEAAFYAVEVDPDGSVWVTDGGGGIIAPYVYRLSQTGAILSSWGSFGSHEGEFWRPHGVKLDDLGNLFIADTDNDRVQKFTREGMSLSVMGHPFGELRNPYGVALDTNGRVYVADIGFQAILKYSNNGEFVSFWEAGSTDDGQRSYTWHLTTDSGSGLYVADSGNQRIQKFTTNGVFVQAWGDSGSGIGQLQTPSGVAVDGEGNILVSDYGNARILKYSSAGVFLAEWGTYGTGAGELITPWDLAVDEANLVYVADTGNRRVQKFTLGGEFILAWNSIDFPVGIDVAGGIVYVAGYDGEEILKFTSDGQLQGKISVGLEPIDVSVDRDGNMFVLEHSPSSHGVQKISGSGELIGSWGQNKLGLGQFNGPEYLALDASGFLYVSDRLNHRVQKFGYPPTQVIEDKPSTKPRFLRVYPNPTRGGVHFEFLASSNSKHSSEEHRVEAQVHDLNGRLVSTVSNFVEVSGQMFGWWDGRLRSGRAISGVYFVRFLVDGKDAGATRVILLSQ